MNRYNYDQIANLFPLTATISQDFIDRTNDKDLRSANNCIGHKALLSAVLSSVPADAIKEPKDKVFWAKTWGSIWIEGKRIPVTTLEDINLMTVTEPVEVTFIIRNNIAEGRK